ncbi:MAG: sugar phosphate isomerase/epimerase [Paracoccaceae bacterium]
MQNCHDFLTQGVDTGEPLKKDLPMSSPIIGAALGVADLPTYANWLREKDRDLELQTFHEASVLNSDWRALADEVKRQLDGYSGRLGIHGPFWGFSIHTKDPDVGAVVAKRLDQGLDVCAAVGATQMVIHSPVSTWDYNNFANTDGSFEKMLETIHSNIGTAVARAENQGVVLVLENIEDIDPNHRKEIVQSFGSTAIRISIDTGHAEYARGANGAPPVDYFVKSAGELLNHIHLQDADGYADRHWAIGEGTIRWHAVFRAIADLQVKPRLILELRDKAGIPASMRFLQDAGLGQ